MRPVGLPWASWVWKTSLGLVYGGDGGESGNGGAEGTVQSPSSPCVEAPESCVWGLMASPFSQLPCMPSGRGARRGPVQGLERWISDEGNQVTAPGERCRLCWEEMWHHFSQGSYDWNRRRWPGRQDEVTNTDEGRRNSNVYFRSASSFYIASSDSRECESIITYDTVIYIYIISL